ncbi:hypothetical protein BU15DRAFT_68595 [Melanogaster broomeanus]|nr:hypothetical protein BU15DRAFT_68595 [Melanogaster broomeanus]
MGQLGPTENPSIVGDYGTISKETGEFATEGNIYSEDFQRLLDASQDERRSPGCNTSARGLGERSTTLIICSSGFLCRLKFCSTFSSNVQSLANAGLHVNFGFSEQRRELSWSFVQASGTLRFQLLMPVSLTSLKTAHKAVKDKRKSVFYARYDWDSVLTGCIECEIPVATVWRDTLAWLGPMNTFNGIYRSGSNAIFVPLSLVIRGIGSGDEPFEWESVRPPWDKLDDDGEEVERYDPTMHSDEESDWEVECEQ